MSYKIFGGLLVVIGLVVFGFLAYQNSHKSKESIVYSPTLMLSALWNTYKQNYWESSSGRTIDRQRGNITTSEGQSYTLLRAVWQDDKPVFDKTWEWTQKNLGRQDDSLLSWLYGQKEDGSYGILTNQGGENTASDADSDIALALLFASERWQNAEYQAIAKNMVSDIWKHEIVVVQNVPYLVANNLEKNSSSTAIINPSYFAPYAYRIFAKIDPAHDWMALVDSSYAVLQKSSVLPLDKPENGQLPPDWILLNLSNGNLQASELPNLTTNYSYDALRIPWRIALDYIWKQEPRAKQTLEQMSVLGKGWRQQGELYSSYSHDGQKLSDLETPAMYGGSIGYFMVADQNLAEKIYETKLQAIYNPDTESWKKTLSYYDDNWAWFGIAMYNNKLIDLFNPFITQKNP